jgi:DNA repair protein RecN (Recombination protein N)
MLEELIIRNFAIIDDLQIRFGPGLTILSGETGAGKSIVIQAVNLLLGGRADAKTIRTGAEFAEVQALFSVCPGGGAAEAMSANDLDPAEGLLIRRVVASRGPNRIYINGQLVTMAMLSAITADMASISGQHAHQKLLDDAHHLLILDQYGGSLSLCDEVAQCLSRIEPALERLCRLRDLQAGRSREMDLLAFERDEIETAALAHDEDERLESEHRLLQNAQLRYQSTQECIERLYSMQGAVVDLLAQAQDLLTSAAGIDPALKLQAGRIEQANLEIADVVQELQSYLGGIDLDGQQLDAVEARLDLITKLKRKYGGTIEAIMAHHAAAKVALDEVENSTEQISALQQQLEGEHQQLSELCHRLSNRRKVAAEDLARKVEGALAALRIPEARFEVRIKPRPVPDDTAPYLIVDGARADASGIDTAHFFIAPNTGEALKPLSTIASGGELSRMVLALKSILAGNDALETLVFDEVDAGIGGETADVVGRKLAQLARTHQVICITHLPQIARFGDDHMRVTKSIHKGRTVTTIERLRKKERVAELARMLGGEQVTAKTLAHADEMLNTPAR